MLRPLTFPREGLNPELDARLRGVVAMLALPELRCSDGSTRRRHVEIELGLDQWVQVTHVHVDHDGATFSCEGPADDGRAEGTLRQWRFPVALALGDIIWVPCWRVDAHLADVAPPPFLEARR